MHHGKKFCILEKKGSIKKFYYSRFWYIFIYYFWSCTKRLCSTGRKRAYSYPVYGILSFWDPQCLYKATWYQYSQWHRQIKFFPLFDRRTSHRVPHCYLAWRWIHSCTSFPDLQCNGNAEPDDHCFFQRSDCPADEWYSGKTRKFYSWGHEEKQ